MTTGLLESPLVHKGFKAAEIALDGCLISSSYSLGEDVRDELVFADIQDSPTIQTDFADRGNHSGF